MASDCVVCQCGTVLVCVHNLTKGYKTKLDECLEAVTDTAHKTIAILEKLVYLLGNCLVSEECCDELTGAVGLVTAGETAGDEYHLCGLKLICKVLYRLCNCCRRKVLDNNNLCLRTCVTHYLSGVELTVCSGEYGDKNLRSCYLDSRSDNLVALEVESGNLTIALVDVTAEYILQLALVKVRKTVNSNSLTAESDCCCLCGCTEECAYILVCAELENE